MDPEIIGIFQSFDLFDLQKADLKRYSEEVPEIDETNLFVVEECQGKTGEPLNMSVFFFFFCFGADGQVGVGNSGVFSFPFLFFSQKLHDCFGRISFGQSNNSSRNA